MLARAVGTHFSVQRGSVHSQVRDGSGLMPAIFFQGFGNTGAFVCMVSLPGLGLSGCFRYIRDHFPAFAEKAETEDESSRGKQAQML